MRIQSVCSLVLSILVLSISTAQTKVIAAEAPQILRQDSFTIGYAPLKVGEQNIAAAYLPQSLGTPRGAILLLHDINEHIDSAAVGILRRGLPAHGWNTLAIKIIRFADENEPASPEVEETDPSTEDVPQPDTTEPEQTEMAEEASTEEAATEETTDNTSVTESPAGVVTTVERIDAALVKLQQEGHERIIIIGQGAGGELALTTVKTSAVPLAALVLINTDVLSEGVSIEDISVPILEIVGSRQKDSVKEAVAQRRVQMKTAQNPLYAVRPIIGADHYFNSTSQQLVNQIHGWLYKQFFADEEAAR